ncbi:MAG: hypothetical protein GY798_25390 [Hyphomicrobiales bacterium]|nr:hypothetical protein [Hyphomicrobiales bacterium]
MTTNPDPVDAVLDAYFDYLEGTGDEPSLDQLDPDDWAVAEQLIASLTAGRGIDPEASRPSLAALLAMQPPKVPLGDVADVALTLEAGLRDVDDTCVVTPDFAAHTHGVDSDLVVVCGGHRLRGIIDRVHDGFETLTPERVAAAAGVFGAFSDIAGVVFVRDDTPDLPGVVVEQLDLHRALDVATGRHDPPVFRRPVADAVSACRAFLHELSPMFEPLDPAVVQAISRDIALPDIGFFVDASVQAVAEKGTKARIPEKKAAWTALGAAEIDALTAAAVALESGETTHEDIVDQLELIAGRAAA